MPSVLKCNCVHFCILNSRQFPIFFLGNLGKYTPIACRKFLSICRFLTSFNPMKITKKSFQIFWGFEINILKWMGLKILRIFHNIWSRNFQCSFQALVLLKCLEFQIHLWLFKEYIAKIGIYKKLNFYSSLFSTQKVVLML